MTVRRMSVETSTKYCTGCHNDKLRTGGLALDPAALRQPASNPEVWEAVVHKLRARAMPPPGLPKPDDAAYKSVTSYLEAKLDAAAAASPRPGKIASAAPPDPHGIPERDPRSARPRSPAEGNRL